MPNKLEELECLGVSFKTPFEKSYLILCCSRKDKEFDYQITGSYKLCHMPVDCGF